MADAPRTSRVRGGRFRHALLIYSCNVVAIIVAVALVDGISPTKVGVVFLAALVFSLVNWIVKPIVTALSLPVVVLTAGVALFFINLLMVYITIWIVPEIALVTFWDAVLATVIIWAVNQLLQAGLAWADRSVARRAARGV
jgi:putative membrane protein